MSDLSRAVVCCLLAASAFCEPAPAQDGDPQPSVSDVLGIVSAATRVGGFVQNIDPETVPVAVDGYFTARYESEVLDELAARTLVIESGGTTVAIQTVDSCGIRRPDFDAAKQIASNATGIPIEHMLIAATHTHTAPATLGGLGTPSDPGYREQLVGQMARSIIEAHKRMRVCEVGWASRDAERFAYCRRWRMKPGTAETVPFTGHAENVAMMNPGHKNPNKIEQLGPVDPEITVLAFRDPETKRPLAMLANFSTHYAGATKMSADYFGVVCRHIGRWLPEPSDSGDPPPTMGQIRELPVRKTTDENQPGFVALMTNGTSGDTNCIDFTQPARVPFDRFDVAEEVMTKAVAAWGDIDEWRTGQPLRVAAAELELGVRRPTADEVAAAREATKDWIDDRLPQSKPEVYAAQTLELAEWPATDTIRLQSLALGEFAVCAIPCEVYASIGLEIKKRSPFADLGHQITIGWANGYSGYLPPPDQHPLGGYTTWRCTSSYLEEGASPKVMQTLLGQLASFRVSGER